MDSVDQLNELFRQGIITEQAYADGLDVINSRQERGHPTPAPRAQALRNDTPTPAPRAQALRNDTPTPRAQALRNDTPTPEQEGLVFRRTPWAIGNFLRCWRMNVPRGHPLGADPPPFLEGVRPQIRQKLTEEILALNGIKFQLAVRVQLRKDRSDGGEEYTDPIIRHKQETILQAAGTAEINEVLEKVFPHILETLEKWTQRGSGWVVDHVSTLWLDIARYKPLRGG